MAIEPGLLLGAQATGTQYSVVIDGVTYRVIQVDSQGRVVLSAVPVHNLLSASHPDTLLASPVAGDLLIANATPAWARLAIGSTDQLLTVVGGLPAWAAAPAAGLTVLNRSLTTVSVVNTITETTVYSFTIPANTLGADGGLYFYLAGTYLNNSGAARNLTVNIKLGATTVFSDTYSSIAASASQRLFNLVLLGLNATASSQKWGPGHAYVGSAGDTGFAGASILAQLAYATSAVNTAVNALFAVTVTHSAASASLQFDKELALLVLIPAS